MWQPTISSDELYHHGILGMHWGKKNGPPYPLGAEDHSQSEKKAGWRKSLSDEQKATIKKAAKITANVAVTALLAYGSYKLVTDPKARALVGKGMQLVHGMDTKRSLEEAIRNSGPEIIGKNGEKIDPDTFDRLINQKASNFSKIIPECKKITSDYAKSSTEQRRQMLENLNKVHGEYNCKAGGLAYEAMRRGMDVTAKDIDTTAIDDTVFMGKCYKNFKGYDTIKGSSIENCEKTILGMFKNGQRGNMIVYNPKGTNSHAMAFEIFDGKLVLIESRNRIEMTLSGLNRRGFSGNGIDLNNIKVVRTDNLEFNDESGFIKRVLKSN